MPSSEHSSQLQLSGAASVTLTPIAYIRSCYPERFGIPRQAGLVPTATATIVFPATEPHRLSLRGLDGFSHIWVLFFLHHGYRSSKPLVRPPRLGGQKTMGVYATRSPNRPNSIGLSAVPLKQIEIHSHEILLHVRGGDFLDGTPVLDIKPYVPYADQIPEATSTWATHGDPTLPVAWSPEAQTVLAASGQAQEVQALITETLAQDPRPGYERGKDGAPGQTWNMRLAGFDIWWQVEAGTATVTRLEPLQ